jgi:hypothetical protein
MALDDFVSPEVGIAVAATAVVASPQVRTTVRRGLVYGLAGLLRAGDAVSAAARGLAESAQQTAAAGVAATRETATEARATARGSTGAASNEGG